MQQNQYQNKNQQRQYRRQNQNRNTNKGEQGGAFDWLDSIKDLVITNVKDIATTTFQETKRKVTKCVQEVGNNALRILISSLMLLAGLVFLMIGLAVVINEMVMFSNSIGYIVVGVMVVLLSCFLNEKGTKKSKKSKCCCDGE
jgi:ABC-type transport system involved in cytochrome bd biosynthesis fused ATPase/permease subunit